MDYEGIPTKAPRLFLQKATIHRQAISKGTSYLGPRKVLAEEDFRCAHASRRIPRRTAPLKSVVEPRRGSPFGCRSTAVGAPRGNTTIDGIVNLSSFVVGATRDLKANSSLIRFNGCDMFRSIAISRRDFILHKS